MISISQTSTVNVVVAQWRGCKHRAAFVRTAPSAKPQTTQTLGRQLSGPHVSRCASSRYLPYLVPSNFTVWQCEIAVVLGAAHACRHATLRCGFLHRGRSALPLGADSIRPPFSWNTHTGHLYRRIGDARAQLNVSVEGIPFFWLWCRW